MPLALTHLIGVAACIITRLVGDAQKAQAVFVPDTLQVKIPKGPVILAVGASYDELPETGKERK